MTSQAIRLLSNLIMTRLLIPEMFGVMAIANIIIVGLAMFSDLGLKQNIIQSKRADDPKFLNTIWTVQIIRGFILASFCLVFAYSLTLLNQSELINNDSVYASHLLPLVLTVLALSPIVQGFESTRLACANRSLYLKKIVTLELIAQLFGFAATLVWVYFDRTIWALVVGAIFSGIIKTSLSYLILPGHLNKLCWDNESFSEIFHFGKWMFLSSILGFLISQGDKLLMGGLMASAAFGLYSIAALLYSSLEGVVSKLISKVAFPALGEINRINPSEIKKKYYKIRLPIDIFCLFMSGMLFISGTTIVDFLYDPRYVQSGEMLEILSLLLVIVRFGVSGQFYLVMGNPKILSILMFTRLIFMIICIPVGYEINSDIGAIWGLVFAYCPGLILTFYYKYKYSLLDNKSELKVIPAFILGMLSGLICNFIFSSVIAI